MLAISCNNGCLFLSSWVATPLAWHHLQCLSIPWFNHITNIDSFTKWDGDRLIGFESILRHCTKVFCAAFLCLQFVFVIFSAKGNWQKAARKMLVKLTKDLPNIITSKESNSAQIRKWKLKNLTFSSNYCFSI